ncbi:Phytolongin Phyl1.1 [Quillaja saponaria]|uniref:Phytolongin Phyl1.1 n=1 Tax=Quillaja saponaria TaxID=32244 RepID=A0AAD7QJ98_QUISA|nr:Phytolongin Phyl1.1 [Quillaja saponaria]
MDSLHSKVYYCCVSKGNRILYAYSGGDHEIETLASLCLDKAPLFHRWYFHTKGKRTYGFLMEDGYVYFTIVDEGFGNLGVLQFLGHVRDAFKKLSRKGSRGSLSSMNSILVQEQLVPIIHRLISSLENVSQNGSRWIDETSSSLNAGLSPSPNNVNGQIEVLSSTKDPLLGKSSKQEKKSKDHVIAMRDVELEERRKSTDRGVKVDLVHLDSNSQGGAGSSISLRKDLGSVRIRSGAQNIRKKWWRQVRIVLAIDAAVCVILFVIWLLICHGISCIR